ncbi:MAG: hypothetical protein K8H88_12950 [Sandaracinaceae bacterium]|nr:hypothetical protein [Sandaracinaceae bacterium]
MRAAFAIAILFVSACGAEPVDERIQGTLTDDDRVLAVDQSRYDEHELELEEGWIVTLELESSAFDAYVHLIDPDGRQIAENDDARSGTTNARIERVAPESGTYRAIANARDATGRGAYVLHIVTAQPAGAAP